MLAYRSLRMAAVLCAALLKLQMVWDFAGIMNGLMAIPNLIGLIGLIGLSGLIPRGNEKISC